MKYFIKKIYLISFFLLILLFNFEANARDKNFDKHAQILRTSLIEDKVQILGPSIKAIYNGPFTLPIMRRNEAMFKVEWKKL